MKEPLSSLHRDKRQFITRSKSSRDVLSRFEYLLNEYFGDLLKKETGRTPQEYIQEKIIEIAKDRISGTKDTVSHIAYSLGFQYPQHLCRLFKKREGCTPNEYRIKMID